MKEFEDDKDKNEEDEPKRKCVRRFNPKKKRKGNAWQDAGFYGSNYRNIDLFYKKRFDGLVYHPKTKMWVVRVKHKTSPGIITTLAQRKKKCEARAVYMEYVKNNPKLYKKMSKQTRPIREIAQEIENTWPNVNYAARPYLDAMHSLENIEDNYIHDSGKSVVLYFLANAGTWRGDDARRIKAELKAICK